MAISQTRRSHSGQAFFAAVLTLGLSACAGPGKKDALRIAEIRRAIELPISPDNSSAPFTLAQLIERAKLVATAESRADIIGLTALSDIDDQAALSMPSVALSADVGHSSFLRREGQGDLIGLRPTINWDFIRLFQRKRLTALRTSTERIATLERSSARDNIEIETVRRFGALVLALNRQQAALAHRNLQRLEAAVSSNQQPEQDAALIENELSRATQAVAKAEMDLRTFCKLGSTASFDLTLPIYQSVTPETLGVYIDRVLKNSALMDVEASKLELREGQLRGQQVERWNGMSLGTSLGNVANLFRASPLFLLSYTYKLLDQGAQRRQELRAQANVILAKLDQRELSDRLAFSAGQIWLHFYDLEGETRAAEAAVKTAEQRARIASEQYRSHAIDTATYVAFNKQLIDSGSVLASKRVETLLATTELKLLAKPKLEVARQ